SGVLLVGGGGPQPLGCAGVAITGGEQGPQPVELGLLAAALTALQVGERDGEERQQQRDDGEAFHATASAGSPSSSVQPARYGTLTPSIPAIAGRYFCGMTPCCQRHAVVWSTRHSAATSTSFSPRRA